EMVHHKSLDACPFCSMKRETRFDEFVLEDKITRRDPQSCVKLLDALLSLELITNYGINLYHKLIIPDYIKNNDTTFTLDLENKILEYKKNYTNLFNKVDFIHRMIDVLHLRIRLAEYKINI